MKKISKNEMKKFKGGGPTGGGAGGACLVGKFCSYTNDQYEIIDSICQVTISGVCRCGGLVTDGNCIRSRANPT